MDKEQMHFAVQWATVLVKLKTASDRKLPVSFDPSEVATLLRGLRTMIPPKDGS